jgi:hypothetical protein
MNGLVGELKSVVVCFEIRYKLHARLVMRRCETIYYRRGAEAERNESGLGVDFVVSMEEVDFFSFGYIQ